MKGWEKGMELYVTNNNDLRKDALTLKKNGVTSFEYALPKGARYAVGLERLHPAGYTCIAEGWHGRISADVVVPVTCEKKHSKRSESELGVSYVIGTNQGKYLYDVLLFGTIFTLLFILLRIQWSKREESLHSE